MEHYVGLDVSLKLTAICIVDRTGKIEREGVVTSDPETIAAFVKSHAPHVARIGLEAGATSTWLWTELNKMGLPVICIDARHAKAALKMQINKSDRNDAVGIARIMQCGWYRRSKPGASGLRSESLPSFCTGCGSRAPNSNGRQRRLPINLHSRTTDFPPIRSAGTNVPAGTLALVRSLLVLRCSREQNALHTLIHQRHLTPSCGGHAPTAERTLNPARMSRRA